VAYDLDDRVAIVTGASAGLGVEFADALAASGANIVLAARREGHVRKVAAAIERDHGVRTLAVRADVAEEADVVRLVEDALKTFGAVDILVNNAGRTIGRPLLEHSLADWRTVVDVNLTGVFLASREAARVMIPRRSGSIINIGSIFGTTAVRQFPIVSYYASKGGVTMLTKALAVELGQHNIRVNEIAPTFFPSEEARKSIFADNDLGERLRRELLWPRTALPTLAKNEYLRGAVCFLASDDSYYVTGARLPVDGGWLAL
jgi:NAD(P)-dependent dehydrogenase (short-subunit alcohol dehydrogenase family)